MKNIFLISICTLSFLCVSAQQPINIKEMGREEILNLTYDQLLELSMEDLVFLTQKMGMSMDDLLNMKLSVTSKTATTLREQPGIVTVYTAEDIEKLGLRDFTDLLRLIQGFNLNYDSQGVLGASMRGVWSFEGKILFLIDGIEMNELLYSTTQLGNRFPIDQIKRVEIIRGPGSSIYGGSAEMGVVNIITKTGEDLNGIALGTSGGYMTKQFGHYGGSLHFGRKWKDLNISVLSNYKEQIRSESYYEDFYGFAGVLNDTSNKIINDNLNIAATYKNLTVRLLYDEYKTYAIYGANESFPERFRMMSSDIKYSYKPNKKFCLTPKINYNYSVPWDDGGGYAHQINRITGNLTAIYDLNEYLNFVGGGEYFYDNNTNQDGSLFYNNSDQLNFYNTSLFGQTIIKTPYINGVLGARYEMHSFYGNAFAPRAGINRTFGNFHFKLLYSKAFRSPSAGNITSSDSLKKYNADIKPETTDVIELELGYRIGKHNFITINFFDININQPIVWYDRYEDSLEYNGLWLYNYNHWGYENSGITGSRGVDLDFQSKYRWGSTNVGYSFYTAKDKNDIESFSVTDFPERLLGNPQHKLTLSGNYKILPKLSFSPSIIWMSETNAYNLLDSIGDPILNTIEPVVLANLMFRLENLPIRNMNIDFGVYDILDQRYPYIEPYNGYYPPFPGGSREFVLKVRYLFKLKE